MSFDLKFVITLCLFAKVCYSNTTEFCKKVDTNIEIINSFHFGEYSVLFTKKLGVYRFKALRFDGKQLIYDSVNEWNNWYGKYSELNGAIHMFDMKYPNNTVRIFATVMAKKQKVNYLTTYAIGINNDVNDIEFIEEVTIDPYNYVPNKDVLNLKSIFEKFPQKYIEYYLRSLMSFPYNDQQMPKRLFVYYEENEPKSTEIVSKIHILRKTSYTLPENNETNWKRDENSGNCFESPPINSSLVISEYQSSEHSKYFFIVEFINETYFVKKVTLSKEKVITPFTKVYSDFITKLFGCEVVSTKVESTTNKHHKEEEESESEADYWVLLSLVIIFSILSFCSVAFLSYLVYKFLKQS